VGVGVGWPDVLFCACTLLKATMSKPTRKRFWTNRLALSVCMCVLTLLHGLINLKLLITYQDGTTCCGPRGLPGKTQAGAKAFIACNARKSIIVFRRRFARMNADQILDSTAFITSAALTSKCDAFQTAFPSRRTITCGVSCRMPVRFASSRETSRAD